MLLTEDNFLDKYGLPSWSYNNNNNNVTNRAERATRMEAHVSY
jgi:hypothetical protein